MNGISRNCEECPRKPPLGLRPRYVSDRKRLEEIRDAITRYTAEAYPIPAEWIAEYNELAEAYK
jgi:hypothetical protein